MQGGGNPLGDALFDSFYVRDGSRVTAIYRRSVTDLSPHRRTNPGSQRPYFPGGLPSKY